MDAEQADTPTGESRLALVRRARRIDRELAATYPYAVAELDFEVVATPFEMVPGITTDTVVHLVQRLLSGPPDAAPVPLAEL